MSTESSCACKNTFAECICKETSWVIRTCACMYEHGDVRQSMCCWWNLLHGLGFRHCPAFAAVDPKPTTRSQHSYSVYPESLLLIPLNILWKGRWNRKVAWKISSLTLYCWRWWYLDEIAVALVSCRLQYNKHWTRRRYTLTKANSVSSCVVRSTSKMMVALAVAIT